jgi:acetyltransferase-like isoleucine patch superfamily enzyme
VRFGRGVTCSAGAGGAIVLGPHTEIGAGTSISASPNASLTLGSNVFVSGGCILAAAKAVTVGSESMIAEFVSIRDHDHDPAYPPRAGRTLAQAVHIGERVWIGGKASVVRGGSIGDDAIVGAHALVNRPIPARAVAVGVPARVVRINKQRTTSIPMN